MKALCSGTAALSRESQKYAYVYMENKRRQWIYSPRSAHRSNKKFKAKWNSSESSIFFELWVIFCSMVGMVPRTLFLRHPKASPAAPGPCCRRRGRVQLPRSSMPNAGPDHRHRGQSIKTFSFGLLSAIAATFRTKFTFASLFCMKSSEEHLFFPKSCADFCFLSLCVWSYNRQPPTGGFRSLSTCGSSFSTLIPFAPQTRTPILF